jgi:hypothetical protein
MQNKKRKKSGERHYCIAAARQDVECVICTEIIHDPCKLNCACDRSFCKTCIERTAIKGRVTCPHCAQECEKGEIKPCSRQWREVLDAIPRRCPNVGCRHKRANYEVISKHAAVECGFRELSCPNDECGQMVLNRKMREHIRLCRGKRCKNFIPPKYGCQEIGTQKEIDLHECKCAVPDEVLNQIRQLLKKKK